MCCAFFEKVKFSRDVVEKPKRELEYNVASGSRQLKIYNLLS